MAAVVRRSEREGFIGQIYALVGARRNPKNAEGNMEHYSIAWNIGHGLWQRDFAGSPGVVGRTLRVGSDLYRIIASPRQS